MSFLATPSIRSILLGLLLLFTEAVVSTPSEGCSNSAEPPLKPGSLSQGFFFDSEAGGGERQFFVHVPREYGRGVPVPLILAFHGKNQSPEEFERQTQLSNPEFNHDAVVVYPQGLDAQWTGDPTAPSMYKVNDVLMVAELLNHLTQNLCVDMDRIHAYGFSNGGGLVDLLACTPQTSSRFASFAATSPAVYKDEALVDSLFSTCPSSGRPVPMLWFHGTKDPVIDIEGAGTLDGPSYPVLQRMRGWAGRNRCDIDNPEVVDLYDGKVQRWSWSSQKNGKNVAQLYKIKDWGHGVPTTWPLDNDYQRFGPTPFNATTLVLDFFKAWPKNVETQQKKPKPTQVKDEL